mgnify:CR=1 FL=1
MTKLWMMRPAVFAAIWRYEEMLVRAYGEQRAHDGPAHEARAAADIFVDDSGIQ